MGMSAEILHAFNLNGEIQPLSGGQNTSFKVNDLVIKPIDGNVQYCEWLLNIISDINPQGYRLSKPIRSNAGTFVYKDWCCTRYEPGEHIQGKIKEKLKTATLFHRDLADKNAINIPKAENRWAKSHRIAWQSEELPRAFTKPAFEVLANLLDKVKLREEYRVQIVHADLSGNILFDKCLDPLIIDFSPTIAPVEYAEAILVCDCIAWQGSSVSEIDLICTSDYMKEMILRAVIFRLSTAAMFAGDNSEEFIREYHCFKPIIDCLH